MATIAWTGLQPWSFFFFFFFLTQNRSSTPCTFTFLFRRIHCSGLGNSMIALHLTQPTSSLRLQSVSPLRQRNNRAPPHRKKLKWLLGNLFSGRVCHAVILHSAMASKTPSPPDGRTGNSPRIEKFSEILIRKSITCEHTILYLLKSWTFMGERDIIRAHSRPQQRR